MDFAGLNKVAAVSEYPRNIKLIDLPKDKFSDVLSIRKVETRNYGSKLIAGLSDRKTVFLPSKVCEYLLENQKELKTLSKLVLQKTVSFKSLGGAGLQWSIKKEQKSKNFFTSKHFLPIFSC